MAWHSLDAGFALIMGSEAGRLKRVTSMTHLLPSVSLRAETTRAEATRGDAVKTYKRCGPVLALGTFARDTRVDDEHRRRTRVLGTRTLDTHDGQRALFILRRECEGTEPGCVAAKRGVDQRRALGNEQPVCGCLLLEIDDVREVSSPWLELGELGLRRRRGPSRRTPEGAQEQHGDRSTGTDAQRESPVLRTGPLAGRNGPER
jgi:hypothetical protein